MITSIVGGNDGDQREDRWIRRFHPSPDSPVRLICFPHAGGSASYYFTVSQTLTPDIEVLAVQYPGRQDRRLEPAVGDLGALAEAIYAAMRPRTDRPFAFFGHSMGAILAFEVARLLRERDGVSPVHLFASGRRAPSCYREGTVHRYDDAALLAELLRNGGTDRRFLDDAEVRATILPVVRADYQAIEGYRFRPGPPLDCPVTALVGDRDQQTTRDEAAAWGEHGTGEFQLRVFPGGHFYLDNHRTAVIELISTTLTATAHFDSIRGGVL
jgi:surfactin synthase thioesterase subunit